MMVIRPEISGAYIQKGYFSSPSFTKRQINIGHLYDNKNTICGTNLMELSSDHGTGRNIIIAIFIQCDT